MTATNSRHVKRLAAQFVVALILVNPLAGTAIVTGIALPPGLLNISFLLLTLVAVLFIVGLINSWNMIDGVDGLAGGAAAVALFWLAVIAALKGAGELGIADARASGGSLRLPCL